MKKLYRRFIRVGGELIPSPRFTKKSDAEEWYHQMRRKKQFLRDGVIEPADGSGPLFIDWATVWIKRRMSNYGPETWKSDEQRLRDYILPLISELPIADISTAQIRGLLTKISEEGFKKKNFKISSETRTRVKALLSVIFSDALNEDPPLVKFNPVLGIKIKEKRIGKKRPRVIADKDSCIKFLIKAKEIGSLHYAVASTFLMTGLRKQELIALRWEHVDIRNRQITVSEKYVQARNAIVRGTKGGEEVTRVVPIPSVLVLILSEFKRNTADSAGFVFHKKTSADYFGPREIWKIIKDVADAAEIDTHPHALRHTFGRSFAEASGNLKALQAILGHSSSSTTDLYSDLAGNRIRGFGEVVSLDIDVKGSGK